MARSAKFEEVMAFRNTLDAETDRGCALMAAAYLDDQLRKLIARTLVQNATVQSQIFEPSGALGTFSARIDFAYLLGHIGPKAHRDLHLLRKIRNDFGHTARPLTFDEPAIAARCRELFYGVGAESLPPRKKFARVVLGVLGPIHALEAKTTPFIEGLDVPIDEKFIARFREWKAEFMQSQEKNEKA